VSPTFLQDEGGHDANSVRADVLDRTLQLCGVGAGLPATVGVPHLDNDITLPPSPPPQTEDCDRFVAVLCAEDDHGPEQRDHTRKHMLSVNERPPSLSAFQRQEWQNQNLAALVFTPNALYGIPHDNAWWLATLGNPEHKSKTRVVIGPRTVTDQANALQVLATMRKHDYAFTYSHGDPGAGGACLGSDGSNPVTLYPADIEATAVFHKLRFWQIQGCGTLPLAQECVNTKGMLHAAAFEDWMSPVAASGDILDGLAIPFAKGAYFALFRYIRGGTKVGEAIRRTRVQMMNWLGMPLPAGHGLGTVELDVFKFDLVMKYGQPIPFGEMNPVLKALVKAALGEVSDCYGWDTWTHVSKDGDHWLWEPEGN